ncbi:YidH family protein [Nocardioides sp. Kera G14]|uniref:YidH family protein n=1 Tax=Nocardioides sp. Kera G14 TaxID=2884264 RepID=UPI00223923F1|nr:DUF202 domain-containing protein [Nocardioides sp. Kera G14]
MGAPEERRPESVYGHGREPDPRFSLANERTFLAWIRTSLGLIAGAVALHSLKVPDTAWVRKVLVVLVLAAGGAAALNAARRWAATERAMRLGLPLPGFGETRVIAVGVAVLAMVLALAFVLL